MQVNVYTEELTGEVFLVTRTDGSASPLRCVRFVLHSSVLLHFIPMKDGGSAVNFWLGDWESKEAPDLATMFDKAAQLIRDDRELQKRLVEGKST